MMRNHPLQPGRRFSLILSLSFRWPMLCLSLATVVGELLPGSGRLPGLPGELQRIYGVHASSTVVAGVAITHTKGDSAIDTSTITVDFEGTSSAETRWALDESSVPPWISVSPTSGFVPAGVDEGALFTVSASSAGVAEQEDPYTASVNLTFASAAVGEVSVKVPILLIVAPATSARNSMWGEARQRTDSIYDCVRPTTVPPPIELEVGLEQSVFFSACDSEGMRVAHMVPSEGLRVAHALSHPNEVEGLYGPKAFKVVLRGQSFGFEYEMKHEYASTGRYRATVLAPLVGEYELFLLLDGTEVDVRSVVANCQPPLVALPDHSCGCDAGLEPGYQDDRSLLEPGALRACQPCSFGFHKALPGNGECLAQQWPIVVSTIGGGLALVIIIALIIVARRVHVHHMLAMEAVEREIAEKQRRICRAMTGVTTLDFPLSVMPLSKLREQGRLVPYEEARDAGALRCCDTVESAVAFAAGRPLIFVSHQWLSLLHPDPEAQHYPIIIRAAEALCARQGLDPDSLHIWLDYHSNLHLRREPCPGHDHKPSIMLSFRHTSGERDDQAARDRLDRTLRRLLALLPRLRARGASPGLGSALPGRRGHLPPAWLVPPRAGDALRFPAMPPVHPVDRHAPARSGRSWPSMGRTICTSSTRHLPHSRRGGGGSRSRLTFSKASLHTTRTRLSSLTWCSGCTGSLSSLRWTRALPLAKWSREAKGLTRLSRPRRASWSSS